jgi:hypothetical protein
MSKESASLKHKVQENLPLYYIQEKKNLLYNLHLDQFQFSFVVMQNF